MRTIARLPLLAVSLIAVSLPVTAQDKWISLFDGKTLEGWEVVGNKETKWEVKDGAICGSGKPSMLVNTTGPYTDFKYHAEVMISDGGNSGLYFRTTRRPGFADGYEAQIDSTHTDPIRTGSLYGMCHVYAQHVKPDTWFTYDLEVRDDVWRGRKVTKIKVIVDGKELYEHLDFTQQFKQGHFAFQQHDPGSRVKIRDIKVMPLGEPVAGWDPLFNGKDLKGWKVTSFGGEGEVIVEKGSVVIEQGVALSGVTSTRKDLPKSNYEIEFEAQRAEGSDFFVGLTFPVKDSSISLICGGWGGGVCGFSSLDGLDASENETTSYHSFNNGQWYGIKVRVTDERLTAWLDGKELCDVETGDRKIDVRFEVDPSKPLGFATYQSTAKIRNARMRRITPKKK